MARWIAIGILALTLAGCSSGAGQGQLEENQRLMAENQALKAEVASLTGENEKLAAENQRLTTEMQDLSGKHDTLVKEVDRLRDLSGRLKSQLEEQNQARCSIPASLLSPHYLNPSGGTDGWAYRKRLTADLDGDGAAETVTVVANVWADPATGEFGWDDGHIWHVYVDEPDSTRTVIFAGWVQMGWLDAMLSEEGRLILQVEQGAGTAIYQVTYRGPDQVEAVELLSFQILDRATFPPGTHK